MVFCCQESGYARLHVHGCVNVLSSFLQTMSWHRRIMLMNRFYIQCEQKAVSVLVFEKVVALLESEKNCSPFDEYCTELASYQPPPDDMCIICYGTQGFI